MRATAAAAALLLIVVSDAAGQSPPQLWSAEVVDAGGTPTVSTLFCADERLRRSFERAVPQVNGRRCEPVGRTVSAGGLFTGRCRAEGRLFVFRTVSDRDPDGSFIVDTMVRAVPPGRFIVAQSRLYWRTGACPAGWRVGDAAAPGAREVRNTLTGEVRRLATPAPRFGGG